MVKINEGDLKIFYKNICRVKLRYIKNESIKERGYYYIVEYPDIGGLLPKNELFKVKNFKVVFENKKAILKEVEKESFFKMLYSIYKNHLSLLKTSYKKYDEDEYILYSSLSKFTEELLRTLFKIDNEYYNSFLNDISLYNKVSEKELKQFFNIFKYINKELIKNDN